MECEGGGDRIIHPERAIGSRFPGMIMSPARCRDVSEIPETTMTTPSSSDTRAHLKGVTLMLTSVALFAVNTLLVRALSLHFPAADAWMASLFRGVLGLGVAIAWYGGRGLQVRRLFANPLVALRGVIGGLAIVIFYVTIVQLGAARAVILNLTYPVFGSIIAALWLKEKLCRSAMLWMLIGLGGLAVFLNNDGKLLRPSAYDLLALAGAAAAGWVVVIIRRLRHDEHASTIFASQALYTLVIAAPSAARLPTLPTMAWFGLALAGVVVGIAQLEMTKAYQHVSVARGSSIQMILPVMTGIGGFLCFGETFSTMEILGALLTLAATWRVVVAR
jgi:drug/metabolite transporter (DMT)-like permease